MHSYEKKTSTVKRFILILILMAIVSATSIYIYDMYTKIEVKYYGESNYVASSIEEKEEKVEDEDIIAKATQCVVGISKIKSTGSLIFSNNNVSDLGLGTRNNYF